MTDYSLPSLPTTVVGSLPRPEAMREALKNRRKGRISDSVFLKVADDSVKAAVALQERAGIDVISDGEMRRENFYSFIAECVDGIKLLSLADLLDYVETRPPSKDSCNRLTCPRLPFTIRLSKAR